MKLGTTGKHEFETTSLRYELTWISKTQFLSLTKGIKQRDIDITLIISIKSIHHIYRYFQKILYKYFLIHMLSHFMRYYIFYLYSKLISCKKDLNMLSTKLCYLIHLQLWLLLYKIQINSSYISSYLIIY